MPSAADLNLFNPETLLDPYDAYAALRAGAPAYYDETLNIHVVSRYDLLQKVIMDGETFSNAYEDFLAQMQMASLAGASPETLAQVMALQQQMIQYPPSLLNLDEPEHTKHRSLVAPLFAAGPVKAAEPAVRRLIADTIAALGQRTTIEFIREFAYPIPIEIIAERVGISVEDRPAFSEASAAVAMGLRLTPLEGPELIRRMELTLAHQQLLMKVVEDRRREPRDDMITILTQSRLQPEDRPLTDGEILANLNQFLVAGFETTVSTFGWGMLMLCQQPELQEELRNDRDRIPTFVEEVLRLESAVQGLPRKVTKDTALDGYPLKAGDIVMIRFGAANRDDAQFEHPEVCNLHRKNARTQLSFGRGKHFCPGAPLARQELTLGFNALLDHSRNFRLDPSRPEPTIEASFVLRVISSLHIEFDPAK